MTGAPARTGVPATATALGRAGLLPFVGATAMIYIDPPAAPVWSAILSTYALVIICFLVGIWWGLALIRRSPEALVWSNVMVLAAFFGHVLLPTATFLLLCALLFPATVVAERRHDLFRPQPPYYARLRLQLTAVATLALLIAAAGIRSPGQ